MTFLRGAALLRWFWRPGIALAAVLCCMSLPVAAQKGIDARWESAGKQGVGTAFDLRSKVWFTLQGGSRNVARVALCPALEDRLASPRSRGVEASGRRGRRHSMHNQ